MYVIGKTHFWKALESCEADRLDTYAEAVCSALAEATGIPHTLTRPDQNRVRRWAKGCFNEPGESSLKFPRVLYACRAANDDEHWILDVFFTRVPNVRGIYSSRKKRHVLPPQLQERLSVSLIESYGADIFMRSADDTIAGTAVGIYVYEKVQHSSSLKGYTTTSRYTPPGSDLKNLLECLPAILPDKGPSSTVFQVSTSRSGIYEFLESCDNRVLSTLGKDRLNELLREAGITADKWLRAGPRRRFFGLFAS